MKNTFSQRHPYLAVVFAGLTCTFFTALGMAIPQILGMNDDFTYLICTIFLIISAGAGILFMNQRTSRPADYGMRAAESGSARKVWYYIPLLILEVAPVIFCGFLPGITWNRYIIIALFVIAVGLNEEIYFRGLALKFMEKKGNKKAIIFTSVVFGTLHLVNAMNGKNLFYLVLQMLFAFVVGFVLAEIVVITKSLLIVIIWHAMHDFISINTGEALETITLVILAFQVITLMVYATGIWKKCNNNQEDDR